jgi:RES domain-containing protein
VNVTAWRIYKPRHRRTAFTGEGARLFGGRFNSNGVAIVYTSASESLASLEMLVHLQSAEILKAYVVRPVTFSEALVKRLRMADLPANWRRNPPPPSIQQIGDRWVAAAESAVLRVPSALIETEFTFLLNPLHPDFAKIRMGAERRYRFDPRLVKRT